VTPEQISQLAFLLYPDIVKSKPDTVSTESLAQRIRGLQDGLQPEDGLRHTCITKLAESQASEHTLMAIAGHVSRKMIEHYSHIRMEAKRVALDAIAKPASEGVSEAGVAQNWAQSPNHEKPAVRN